MKSIVSCIIKSLEAITKYLKQDGHEHQQDPRLVPAAFIEEKGFTYPDDDIDIAHKGKPVGITQQSLDRYRSMYEKK